jgi:hypothetical protein
MVEFWACVGLACFNKKFFEDIRQVDDGKEKDEKAAEDAAEKAVNDWLFRLSCSEFRDLRKLVLDPDIAAEMRHLQEKEESKRLTMRLYRCKPPQICD